MIFRRKKKISEAIMPTGLQTLDDVSDERIMADLDRMQYLLVPQFEQITTASAIWLGTMHGSTEWDKLRAGILREIRRIDAFTTGSADDMNAGIEFFYALLYHIFLWHNTLMTLDSWQQCVQAGEAIKSTMPTMPPPKDDRGYA